MEEKKAYAHREKVYISGNIFPDIQVGMQKVNLTPTVEIIDGDYAHLKKEDDANAELKLVARALLPESIAVGSRLKYEMLQYELV